MRPKSATTEEAEKPKVIQCPTDQGAASLMITAKLFFEGHRIRLISSNSH